MVDDEDVELPRRMKNLELLMIVREHYVERKVMRKEMENLKEQVNKGIRGNFGV